MTAQQVTVADLLNEASLLARRHAILLGGVWAAATAGFTALDWNGAQLGDDVRALWISGLSQLVVAVLVQYLVTERLLGDRHPRGSEPRPRRFGSLLAVVILSGFAIVVGLAFLILPGLYLAARWFTVSARVVEDNLGATEALRRSWQDSRNSVPAFMMGVLLSIAPVLLSILVVAGEAAIDWPSFQYDYDESFESISLSAAVSALASVAGWVLGAAAFRKVVPVRENLQDVFA